jgi:hypothetical protein
VFRQRGLDTLAQCRLGVCPGEINAKTDSSGLGEEWLDDRQDCQLSSMALRDR